MLPAAARTVDGHRERSNDARSASSPTSGGLRPRSRIGRNADRRRWADQAGYTDERPPDAPADVVAPRAAAETLTAKRLGRAMPDRLRREGGRLAAPAGTSVAAGIGCGLVRRGSRSGPSGRREDDEGSSANWSTCVGMPGEGSTVQRVHLGDAGQGVNRPTGPTWRDVGQGAQPQTWSTWEMPGKTATARGQPQTGRRAWRITSPDSAEPAAAGPGLRTERLRNAGLRAEA